MATFIGTKDKGFWIAIIIVILVIIIIIGLFFGFILGDIGLSSNKKYKIAEINGIEIDYRDFEQQVTETSEGFQSNYNLQSLTEEQKQKILEMVWDNVVQRTLLESEYKKIGLSVTDKELVDLNLEKQVKESKLIRKYLVLIEKGLYEPMPLVENEFKCRNYQVDFDFVGKAYNDIPDNAVVINQEELEKYYNAHKEEYKQEKSRDIAYVTFDVIPSENDIELAKNWIDKLTGEFKMTDNNEQFINFNSDAPFKPTHFKKGDLNNAALENFAFNSDIGEIFGPYTENESIKIAKLLQINNLPDTIEAKHIIIAIDGKKIPDIIKAKQVADSLKKAIEGGSDFATLAKEFSADKSSGMEGGKLGKITEGQTINQMPIDIFNELAYKKLNELVIVEKEYGIHILVKTASGPLVKKVQLGFIERKIEPSKETYELAYSRAVKFADSNKNLKQFEETIAKEKLVKKSIHGLTENGNLISGLESPRPLIRWAYNANIGDVSEVFELGKKFVVGALVDIRKKGIAPLRQVEEMVKLSVLRDKKAEMLIKQFSQNLPSDMEGLAQKMKTEVHEAKNISFSTFLIPEMGYEPVVIANAVTLEKNKISAPLKGENGVYLINVKIITPAMSTEKMDLSADKTKLMQELQARIYPDQTYGGTGQAIGALKESAEIEDLRSKFY